MCGLAGLVPPRGRPEVDGAVLGSMLRHLEHRGPDDQGFLLYADGEIRTGRQPARGRLRADAVLLHRRLSIIDLSARGWQPMSSPDGACHIVFNGEIYNYVELGRSLERQGHVLRSRSDTEVLLTAYMQWGPECLGQLVGMFAFAVLDLRARALFLARDPFGIKPLYFARPREGFAFASEIGPLLDLAGVERRVSAGPLYGYLVEGRTDTGRDTLFQSVKEVPAAHCMHVPLDDPAGGEPCRYWDLGRVDDVPASVDAAAAELRDRFLDNVELHLRSDVPVGAALSGGVDSSAIVCSMRRMRGPSLDIHTFSYIAEGSNLNEERWVDVVREASGVQAHKVTPGPGDLVRDLPRLLRIQELPFGSTNIYAQYRVFGLAREHGIKVMLDGQGADEMLAGYSFYAAVRLASLIRKWRLVAAARLFAGARAGVGRSGSWLATRAGQFLVPRALERPLRSLARADRNPPWLRDDWFRERSTGPLVGERATRPASMREAMTWELTRAGLGALLRYEDRNSMAHSIESRVPFLTAGLAEFLLSLPEEFLLSPGGESKDVFRRAMRGIVPDSILDRSDKIGFSTPEGSWLRDVGEWADAVLAPSATRDVPVLDGEWVAREWRAVREGRLGFRRHVWRWINLVEWAHHYEVSFE